MKNPLAELAKTFSLYLIIISLFANGLWYFKHHQALPGSYYVEVAIISLIAANMNLRRRLRQLRDTSKNTSAKAIK